MMHYCDIGKTAVCDMRYDHTSYSWLPLITFVQPTYLSSSNLAYPSNYLILYRCFLTESIERFHIEYLSSFDNISTLSLRFINIRIILVDRGSLCPFIGLSERDRFFWNNLIFGAESRAERTMNSLQHVQYGCTGWGGILP